MSSIDFVIRRVHSLTGIVPIGLFLLEHIFSVSQAIAGPVAFDKTVAGLQNVPFLLPIEITAIAIPITFHALYGLYIVYVANNNQLTYTYFHNWMFYLQRVTAIITTVFLIWHVWVLRVGKALYGIHINFQYMSGLLSDPVTFVLYIIGLVAAVFHLANGLWTFLITWGITIGPRSQKTAAYVCGLLFFILNALGITAIIHFVNY